MRKNYIKPAIRHFDMAQPQIMSGSVSARARVGISSFRTDDDDWTTETDEETGSSSRKYKFWE